LSDGARLHSAYNPEKEARKYIDSLSIPSTAAYLILIECGRGYLIPPLREKCPDAKIISLHFCDEYRVPGEGADASWSPALPLSLDDFLEQHIEDTESSRIKIVEWRPALALSGASYTRLLAETAAFIRRADANKRSADYFRQRRLKNRRRNLLIAAHAPAAHTPAAPHRADMIVCAAGPGLAAAAAAISALRAQGNCALLAVSSAARALLARGLYPDIVFSCDSGNWARLHLFELFRQKIPRPPLIAAALSAALPSNAAAFPLLFFGDGSAEEAALLSKHGLPPLALAERGTVTAAALDFALAWTAGRVFLAGADLACAGLATHAAPYAFDRLSDEVSGRLSPAYHLRFERACALDRGGSFKVYADWFAKKAGRYPARLFNLGENNRAFPFKSVRPEELLLENII
jgi:hypothetical protein